MKMDNLNLAIINEMLEIEENNEGWKIDSDSKAEWAGNKLREEAAESQRIINTCNTMINEYKIKIEKEKEKLQQKKSFFEHHLKLYFETVEKKETPAGNKKYKLPSIILEEKKKDPDYVRDDKKLVPWLKENNMSNFIKTEEKTDWANLKKKIIISGHNAVDENGEVIPGIEIKERPPEFIVKI
jgi:hypothetical protein